MIESITLIMYLKLVFLFLLIFLSQDGVAQNNPVGSWINQLGSVFTSVQNELKMDMESKPYIRVANQNHVRDKCNVV